MDKRLIRQNDYSVSIDNDYGINAILFANEKVPLESVAVDELFNLFKLKHDVALLNKDISLDQVVITPDFHKGSGIPIGTVISTNGFSVPQAIGSDINCGMRLHITSLNKNDLVGKEDDIETVCRHTYFEGGRNIPMNKKDRNTIFTHGISGLFNNSPSSNEGLWKYYNRTKNDVFNIENFGEYSTDLFSSLEQFLGNDQPTRDDQIGCIGGGNHFVEIQYVDKILDNKIAYEWGIKKGSVVVMIHSGSLSIGKFVSNKIIDLLKNSYPKDIKHPSCGVFPCLNDVIIENAIHNAANFAFANRMFLALMMWQSLEDVLGEFKFELLYDSPHNMFWKNGENYIHRKGSCPARGPFDKDLINTPFEFIGEPVIIPGSMGASSYLLVGKGNKNALSSAAHGAGRAISRGASMKGHDSEFREFLEKFRIITPVDFRRSDIKSRPDIFNKKLDDLKQEAPFAYKGITDVIKTIEQADIAGLVAELKPIMTVKG